MEKSEEAHTQTGIANIFLCQMKSVLKGGHKYPIAVGALLSLIRIRIFT